MRKTPINSIIQSIPTHDFVDDWIILDCIVDWSFSYDLFKGWYCKIWKICASSRIQGTRGLSFNCNRLRRCNGITWAPVVQQHHRMRPLRWSCLRRLPETNTSLLQNDGFQPTSHRIGKRRKRHGVPSALAATPGPYYWRYEPLSRSIWVFKGPTLPNATFLSWKQGIKKASFKGLCW